jgi:8-oxo-dGTP pyrophosphatase MutT (NUDIX family)
MNWKLLKSEYLFKDLWFTVRKDTCERSGGQIVDPYYVYEFPEWVTAVAVTKEGKFIFERQYRHAAGLTMLEIPGGCVDKTDKNLEEAIARELKEETGYSFVSYTYLGKTSANPSTHNNWMHFFLAKGGALTHQQQLDQNEEIELVLLELQEVKELLKQQGVIQSMHVTALFYALHHMGELNW